MFYLVPFTYFEFYIKNAYLDPNLYRINLIPLSVQEQFVKGSTTATAIILKRNKAIQKQPPSGVLYKRSS